MLTTKTFKKHGYPFIFVYRYLFKHAIYNSIPIACLFLALFFMGQVFSLNVKSYGFFCYFISMYSFDPLLSKRHWLQSLFYNTCLSSISLFYLLCKSLLLAFCATCVAYLSRSFDNLYHIIFLFSVILNNFFICQVVSFMFEDVLPFAALPLLCLTIVSFNGFFFSSGLEKDLPWDEMKIFIALFFLVLSLVNLSLPAILELKYGPYSSTET